MDFFQNDSLKREEKKKIYTLIKNWNNRHTNINIFQNTY